MVRAGIAKDTNKRKQAKKKKVKKKRKKAQQENFSVCRTRVSRRLIQVTLPVLIYNIPLVKSFFFGLFDLPLFSCGSVEGRRGKRRVWLRKICLCFHSAKPAHSKHVPPTMRSAVVWLSISLPFLPLPDAKAPQLQELFLILTIRL